MTDCPRECPFCARTACRACADIGKALVNDTCLHGRAERHAEIPAPLVPEVATRKIEPLLMGRIEVDFGDPDEVARFFEKIGAIVRAKGKLVVIVE